MTRPPFVAEKAMGDSPLKIGAGAVYRIRLQGVLDGNWRHSIGDMQIVSYRSAGGNEALQTILVGEVADQAALAGLLNLAYNLGLPLLDVTYLGEALENC